MKKLFAIGCFLYFSTALSAQPYHSGTVQGIYPEGVLIQRSGGTYLVPQQQATFQLGDLRVTWNDLQPGQRVNYYVPNNGATYIENPQQWKRRYHPRHPHGAPPGQKKKWKRGRRW